MPLVYPFARTAFCTPCWQAQCSLLDHSPAAAGSISTIAGQECQHDGQIEQLIPLCDADPNCQVSVLCAAVLVGLDGSGDSVVSLKTAPMSLLILSVGRLDLPSSDEGY